MSETVELTTERMSFGPSAVGRLEDGKVVFVRGGAPREKVRARLTKSHKKYWDAEIEEILEPSVDRVQALCSVYGRCGGCDWQHLSYEAQLREKRYILTHQIARATGRTQDELDDILQVHASKKPFGYRNRVQIHGDVTGIGFYAPRSKTLIPTDRCIVACDPIQKRWTGFMEKDFKDLVERQAGRPFKIEWTEKGDQILEAINQHHAALGFTQVNNEQNFILQEIVRNAAGREKLLLDLFGGDGNLSRDLPFEKIICVDLYNSGPLLSGNFQLVRQSSESFLRAFKAEVAGQPDVILCDPPREGLERTARSVAEVASPKVILVSCDPSTLGRDLSHFDQYMLVELHLVDMFPQTHHLEAVAVLQHRQS